MLREQSKCWRPAPRPHPGLSGTARALERGCAAVGPMDSLSFRLANRVLGNPMNAAALRTDGVRPHPQVQYRRRDLPDRRRRWPPISMVGRRDGYGHRGTLPAKLCASARFAARAAARIWRSRRLRCAALPGKPLDIYAGQIRRSRRPRADRGRCAASRCFECHGERGVGERAVRGARDSGGSAARDPR